METETELEPLILTTITKRFGKLVKIENISPNTYKVKVEVTYNFYAQQDESLDVVIHFDNTMMSFSSAKSIGGEAPIVETFDISNPAFDPEVLADIFMMYLFKHSYRVTHYRLDNMNRKISNIEKSLRQFSEATNQF
jgi:hypothetical protein